MQGFTNEPLCIDAISINQSDDAENAEEFKRMNEIYTGAMEVLLWLGDINLPEGIVDIILKVSAYSPALNEHAKSESSALAALASQTGLGPSGDWIWRLKGLCGLEYWNRSWVT